MENVLSVLPKYHNNFKFQIRRVGEDKPHTEGKAENIVLNSYLTQVLQTGQIPLNLHLGTGTGTLSPARTSLFTFALGLGRVSRTVDYFNNMLIVNIRFEVGAAQGNGLLFTEVGLALSTNANALVTHALITDSENNPITLSKTNTEILTINATLYAEFPQDDITGRLRWVKPAAANQLMRRLAGDPIRSTTTTEMAIPNMQLMAEHVGGDIRLDVQGASSTRLSNSGNTWTGPGSFGTASGNGTFVYGIHLSYVGSFFESERPGFNGYLHENVALGNGNGSKTGFVLPRCDKVVGTPQVYIDDVLQDPSTYTVNTETGLFIEQKDAFLGSTVLDPHLHPPRAMAFNGRHLIVAHDQASGPAALYLSIYDMKPDTKEPPELLSRAEFVSTENTNVNAVVKFLRPDTVVLPGGVIHRFNTEDGTIGIPFQMAGDFLATGKYFKSDLTGQFPFHAIYAVGEDKVLVSTGGLGYVFSIDYDAAVAGTVIGPNNMDIRYYFYGFNGDFIFTQGSVAGSTYAVGYRINPTTLATTRSFYLQATGTNTRTPFINEQGHLWAILDYPNSRLFVINIDGDVATPTTVSLSIPAGVGGNSSSILGPFNTYDMGDGTYLLSYYPQSSSTGSGVTQVRRLIFNSNNNTLTVAPFETPGMAISTSLANGMDVYAGGKRTKTTYAQVRSTTTYDISQNVQATSHATTTQIHHTAPGIVFNIPPANGAVVKANYRSYGLFKQDRVTVSASATITAELI